MNMWPEELSRQSRCRISANSGSYSESTHNCNIEDTEVDCINYSFDITPFELDEPSSGFDLSSESYITSPPSTESTLPPTSVSSPMSLTPSTILQEDFPSSPEDHIDINALNDYVAYKKPYEWSLFTTGHTNDCQGNIWGSDGA